MFDQISIHILVALIYINTDRSIDTMIIISENSARLQSYIYTYDAIIENWFRRERREKTTQIKQLVIVI